jgi:hypothetical protein
MGEFTQEITSSLANFQQTQEHLAKKFLHITPLAFETLLNERQFPGVFDLSHTRHDLS